MRRWLTAQYDWTGLARLFYTSPAWEVIALIIIGVLVVLGFVIFHGPVVTDRVELNTFAPKEIIHVLDLIMAGGLSFFLLSNVFRMYRYIIHRGVRGKVPFSLYITETWNLLYHFVTQNRFSKCEDRRRWINHLLLVSGYVIMFILVVGLLFWFQTDNLYPIYHPQRWVGYYATIVLIYASADVLWGRIKKEHQIHRFSHLSDWIFPILLILVAVSGIVTHSSRYLGWPLTAYYSYVAHLAIAVPMLVVNYIIITRF